MEMESFNQKKGKEGKGKRANGRHEERRYV
jgi:hypothetical protein